MPIKIPDSLPAAKTLETENIFVMSEHRAVSQDIRPLRIAILNLMPTKVETETQLIRMLSNSPLQVDIELLQTSSYTSKNTSHEHLLAFYKTFDQIKDQRFDGMIITGAPIELLDFEQVDYWPELCQIMEWTRTNVYSTLHICWGAQAGLYYHYGINKYTLPAKTFGVFEHKNLIPSHPLMRGFDSNFLAPHSRHTDIDPALVEACPKVQILASSDKAGLFLMSNSNGRRVFVTGHPEYDPDTLSKEYFRDVNKGMDIDTPYNYFPDNDPTKAPPLTWRAHGNLLYSNWLNYFVYQETPYNLDTMPPVV